MDMIQWLSRLLETQDTKLLYILTLIMIANTLDILMGWINAKFNKTVSFSSGRAIYGIARKMVLFIICIYFIPVSLLIPDPVGVGALYVLLITYLASEINSILSHLRLTDDNKTVDVFIDFVEKIFTKENDKK